MISEVDLKIINFCKKISMPVSRLALFVVFFWFGALKVVGLSPASQVVQNLFNETMPIMEFSTFIILFGLYECLIGLLFLIRGTERVVIPLLLVHLVTTVGPLVLLPGETWSGVMVPTMEGQYIIKNVLIIALALGIAAHLTPLYKKN